MKHDAARIEQVAQEMGYAVARELAQYLLGIGSARGTGRLAARMDAAIGRPFNARKKLHVRQGYMAGYREAYR